MLKNYQVSVNAMNKKTNAIDLFKAMLESRGNITKEESTLKVYKEKTPPALYRALFSEGYWYENEYIRYSICLFIHGIYTNLIIRSVIN